MGKIKACGSIIQTSCAYRCNGKGHTPRFWDRKGKNSESKSSDSSNLHVNSALEEALIASLAEFENVEANVISLIKSKPNTSDAIDLWLTDSACSAHMTPRQDWFVQYEWRSKVKVYLGDNSTCDAIGKGAILLFIYFFFSQNVQQYENFNKVLD